MFRVPSHSRRYDSIDHDFGTKVTMPMNFGLFLRVVTGYRTGDVRFEFDLSVSRTFINVAEPPPLKTIPSDQCKVSLDEVPLRF